MSFDAIPQRVTGPGWALTTDAFERLLRALDSDRDRAAHAYEHLRERLMGLLRWWGAEQIEDLADATLDRVARKLEEGTVIPPGSLGAYVRGVARMVFYESTRKNRVQDPSLLVPTPPPDEGREAALLCFDRCISSLAEGDRTLVLRYYADGRAAEIRRQLAAELGISSTALRLRAHRLRERLEVCVTGCLGQP